MKNEVKKAVIFIKNLGISFLPFTKTKLQQIIEEVAECEINQVLIINKSYSSSYDKNDYIKIIEYKFKNKIDMKYINLDEICSTNKFDQIKLFIKNGPFVLYIDENTNDDNDLYCYDFTDTIQANSNESKCSTRLV